ncbi:helix-turn-helix domain-containing protein, partial [Klebsiella pneumoniae]|nr:helix-turn-helix domain-containing protein [Klebsiella pneumoniae]
MDTVGSRLRFRRKQKKLTQRDIAEWAGVSASAVTQWESDVT